MLPHELIEKRLIACTRVLASDRRYQHRLEDIEQPTASTARCGAPQPTQDGHTMLIVITSDVKEFILVLVRCPEIDGFGLASGEGRIEIARQEEVDEWVEHGHESPELSRQEGQQRRAEQR